MNLRKQPTGKNLNKKEKNINLTLLYLVLIFLIIIALIIEIILPLNETSSADFLRLLFRKTEHTNAEYILYSIRFPRIITAVLVGSGLSVAGLMLQTLFHNPLAGPYVLGISSGAGLGVAIYTMSTVLFAGIQPLITAGGQAVAAMIGSGLVFFLILLFSFRLNDSVSLLIVGIMTGSLVGAIVGILQYFGSSDSVHKFVIWSLGSLGSVSWIHIIIILPVYLISIIASILIIKPLDFMLMGETHARVSGVNVRLIRIIMIIIASLLAGTLTAFAGPIAFVGMTIPHLTRLLFGKINHKNIIPGVILSGTLLMLICDIISQVPGKATVLPINSVTAIFGAPVVVFLILHNRKTKSTF
jgi:iron complex transport system permease protein